MGKEKWWFFKPFEREKHFVTKCHKKEAETCPQTHPHVENLYSSKKYVPTLKHFVINYITSDSREFTKSANSMAFCVHHFLVINYSYILKDKNETWRTFITNKGRLYGPNFHNVSGLTMYIVFVVWNSKTITKGGY